jgi:hypothetical protein
MILNGAAAAAAQRAIVIAGAARSGTTMMGLLLGSLRQIEYLHEPPLLHSLFTEIDSLPAPSWRFLYETYLFEDFLIDAVAGRRLNFNKHDQSSAHHTKSDEELSRRLARSWSRRDAYKEAERCRVCYKIPDLTPFLGKLLALYPETTAVVMVRRAESVIRSVLRRGWFSNAGLSNVTGIWPLHPGPPPHAPYWLPADDIEAWRGMSELERCCHYYMTIYAELTEHHQIIVVDYDDFIDHAAWKFAQIAEKIGHGFGDKTQGLLSNVAEPLDRSSIDLTPVPAALLDRLRSTEQRIKARALA